MSILIFFIFESYKYPSQFNNDCSSGVNGADNDGYFWTQKGDPFHGSWSDHEMKGLSNFLKWSLTYF